MEGTLDLLAVLAWAGAGGGAICVAVALARPSKRRAALVFAAVLFLPMGIVGILSIGIVFLVAAAFCLVGAALSRPRSEQVAEPTS